VTAIWTPIESLSLSSTLLFVSSWRDLLRGDTTQFIDQPGYAVVNVAANYTVNENATLFSRVDNLLNEHYQDPNGFDRPGVGVFGGLRLTH
jgi:vitamin B12 transporter